MRLSRELQHQIKRLALEEFGDRARVIVFGSRVDDTQKGGDLDLLLQLPYPVENPALQAARFSTLVSRLMDGRKVDVLLQAPQLKVLPVHRIAEATGVPL